MKTILIAEDIESNFLLVKAILSKKYNLVRAETGQEAIDMFKETNPDLILMDIKMPMMDGIEATKVIRTISKDVPMIALTAYAYDSDKEQALAAGCDDFLTKPLDRKLLIQKVIKYCGE